ncbi:hypothetical protein FHT82_000477 [Rhizobium sp. BK275]|uniref:hypothetical protein n=1 Tax=Rhizobium sp. BK275 TaxID=2587077 RepID=UPI0016165F93|nr:hypothetical protein [Rhizobium sp. BK275]MBB3387757.1 hypothetical protein [Rhizobium sp. BK275]
MFGALIASLDNPEVMTALVGALGMEGLDERLEKAAAAEAMDPPDYLATVVRSFLEMASDDDFVQLVGIMNRAEDPGLAAVRSILRKTVLEQGTL